MDKTIKGKKIKTVYEYGAMSSKYSLKADNKLTAYATIILHYRNAPHLVVVYSPESCKEDRWANMLGQISERLDEIFGGEGSFDKYLEDHVEDIQACYRTIKQIV